MLDRLYLEQTAFLTSAARRRLLVDDTAIKSYASHYTTTQLQSVESLNLPGTPAAPEKQTAGQQEK